MDGQDKMKTQWVTAKFTAKYVALLEMSTATDEQICMAIRDLAYTRIYAEDAECVDFNIETYEVLPELEVDHHKIRLSQAEWHLEDMDKFDIHKVPDAEWRVKDNLWDILCHNNANNSQITFELLFDSEDQVIQQRLI